MSYCIKMVWDGEASVWIATSDNVPGLVLESESFDNLIRKVRSSIPELLSLVGKPKQEYRLN